MTVAPTIVLRSKSGSLTLTLDAMGVGYWCQVHLLVSGTSRPLGAERLEYVTSNLLSFLREAEAKTGIRSVLGLSELHTCIYGEHIGQRAILHFQDADARMVAKIVLTAAEKSQWIQLLTQHAGD